MTIEIHELIIEARVSDDVNTTHQHQGLGEMAAHYEQQLIARISREVLRQVLTQLREESWGVR